MVAFRSARPGLAGVAALWLAFCTSLFAQPIGDQPGAIGAIVIAEEGGFRLQEVFPASPAEQAGLRPGDLIVKIGEVRVADLEPDEALFRLRGRAFTKVRLTVTRLGIPEPMLVEVFRAPLDQFHGPR